MERRGGQAVQASVEGPLRAGYDRILNREALAFVADLTATFAGPLERVLGSRRGRGSLDFLPATREIRESSWTIDPIPQDLARRIVEITGPVDRKMIINALNSGADVFMADFEDSCSPTWDNLIQGQLNLVDAVRGTIRYDDPRTGKAYRLRPPVATLMVRPRGLHLVERHCRVGACPVPAALFDFGLYLFHNAAALLDRGSGPYFYLPKLESHLEARLWNDVFLRAQAALGLAPGTIKATVLIETLPAAFEMDEILYELRQHSAGLNCGRWDYIFSFIKNRRSDPEAVLPDRSQVTMEQPFLRAYTQLVVRTCHRRRAHAIGGMAAQIPIKDDPEASLAALDKVRRDKLREVGDGHDGTWVAHPGLVSVAREAFEARMQGPHQLDRLRDDVSVAPADLLRVPAGTRTEAGLRLNVRVGVQYLEAWLGGNGCVPLYNLMEDAATAEISRTQIWQWLRHGAHLSDGEQVTRAVVERILDDEMRRIAREIGPERFARGRFEDARALFAMLCFAPELDEFLTTVAYQSLNGSDRPQAEERR